MSRFSRVLGYEVFSLEMCTKEEIETLANQLGEMNSAIATSLEAIGTAMFWASDGDSNGDNRIPQHEAIDTFSQIGELMQILSALSNFSLAKESQCRDMLKGMKNNEAPKTAINGASNIQPRTI